MKIIGISDSLDSDGELEIEVCTDDSGDGFIWVSRKEFEQMKKVFEHG